MFVSPRMVTEILNAQTTRHCPEVVVDAGERGLKTHTLGPGRTVIQEFHKQNGEKL